jgi:hypothetical protein
MLEIRIHGVYAYIAMVAASCMNNIVHTHCIGGVILHIIMDIYLIDFCIARKDYVTSNPHKVTISFNFAHLYGHTGSM